MLEIPLAIIRLIILYFDKMKLNSLKLVLILQLLLWTQCFRQIPSSLFRVNIGYLLIIIVIFPLWWQFFLLNQCILFHHLIQGLNSQFNFFWWEQHILTTAYINYDTSMVVVFVFLSLKGQHMSAKVIDTWRWPGGTWLKHCLS